MITGFNATIYRFAAREGGNDYAGIYTSNVLSDDASITSSNIPPSVSSIVRADANPTSAAMVDYTVIFGESVTGVDTGDFSLTTTGGVAGATVDSVSGSGATYTVMVDTGTGSGTIRLDLDDDDSISDGTDPLGPGDGSYNSGESYSVDKDAPGITSFELNTPPTSPTNFDTLVFRATFDEAVQNVTTGDFSVTGSTATITNVIQQSTSIYDITVSGGDLAGLNGTVQLNLAGGQDITDAYGNSLPAVEPGTDQTYMVDNTPPTVLSINPTNTTPTNADSVDFTVTFSDPVSDIETGDFVLAATGTASGTINNVSSASGTAITVTVNGITGDGTLGLNFDYDALDSVQGTAGNVASTDFTGQTYDIDNTDPTVTINQAGGQSDPGTSSPINFTAVFSETVTGFNNTADVALSGTANATTSTITGTGAGPYNVAVSGMTSIGTVIADINSGRAQDAAGNTNVESTFTDHQVTYNPPAPTVSSINRTDTNPTNASSVDFTITFDQSVDGIDTGDFSLALVGTAGDVAYVSSGSGSSVTVTVDNISGDGTLGLNLVDDD